MGCDIHPFVEIRIKGIWYFLSYIDIGRNYAFFNALSGVRGESKGYAEDNGVPDDSSQEVLDMVEAWEDDAHSHCHLYAHEVGGMLEYYEECYPEIGSKKEDSFIHKELTALENLKKLPHIEDVRMVAWYDN